MAYIISLEKEGKYRCGEIYRIKAKCSGQEIEGLIDLNHEAHAREGRIFFERREDPRNGERWDYKKWPCEHAVLSLELFEGEEKKDELIREINCLYRKQEEEWKI